MSYSTYTHADLKVHFEKIGVGKPCENGQLNVDSAFCRRLHSLQTIIASGDFQDSRNCWNDVPIRYFRGKDVNASEDARRRGNALFADKKLPEALVAYNEAVRHAPFPTGKGKPHHM